VGPWGGCTALCGDGVRNRDITCYKVENDTIVSLEDEECSQDKPNQEEPCQAESPCAASDWITTEWSGCQDSCGTFKKAADATMEM
jgi:hypothetical protein